MVNRYFTHDTFEFLSSLAANNRREWFEEHRPIYEATVRTPPLSDAVITAKSFYPKVLEHFAAAAPYMRYLCKALDLRF